MSLSRYVKIASAACILLLLLSKTSNAQRFRGGIIGGISTSQISGDGLAGYHQVGACIGGSVALQLNQSFSMQFEMLFIQKGSSTLGGDTLPDGTPRLYHLRLNYFEFPLLLNYHFKRFIFEAGPSIAYLISYSEEDINGTIDFDYAPIFKKSDLSFNLGASYPLYKSLYLNVRFSNSLLVVRDTPTIPSFFNLGGQYNSVIQFTLRYYFEKSKQPDQQ